MQLVHFLEGQERIYQRQLNRLIMLIEKSDLPEDDLRVINGKLAEVLTCRPEWAELADFLGGINSVRLRARSDIADSLLAEAKTLATFAGADTITIGINSIFAETGESDEERASTEDDSEVTTMIVSTSPPSSITDIDDELQHSDAPVAGPPSLLPYLPELAALQRIKNNIEIGSDEWVREHSDALCSTTMTMQAILNRHLHSLPQVEIRISDEGVFRASWQHVPFREIAPVAQWIASKLKRSVNDFLDEFCEEMAIFSHANSAVDGMVLQLNPTFLKTLGQIQAQSKALEEHCRRMDEELFREKELHWLHRMREEYGRLIHGSVRWNRHRIIMLFDSIQRLTSELIQTERRVPQACLDLQAEVQELLSLVSQLKVVIPGVEVAVRGSDEPSGSGRVERGEED